MSRLYRHALLGWHGQTWSSRNRIRTVIIPFLFSLVATLLLPLLFQTYPSSENDNILISLEPTDAERVSSHLNLHSVGELEDQPMYFYNLEKLHGLEQNDTSYSGVCAPVLLLTMGKLLDSKLLVSYFFNIKSGSYNLEVQRTKIAVIILHDISKNTAMENVNKAFVYFTTTPHLSWSGRY